MSIKRLCIAILSLGLGLALAGAAQATQLQFSLVGGGGQIHIGNGLALPIQQAATPGQTGTVFPPLGVPVRTGPAPLIAGTIVKSLKSTAGGKQGYQRRLSVPVGVLSKAAGQTTVGVKFSNPNLFAVGTNLKFTWPAAPAVLSTGAAVGGGGTGVATISAHGGSMTYSNALGKRFGGPAHFALSPGAPAGDFPQAPVTIWLKVNLATPACTHSAPFFGGPPATPNTACVAGVVLANPTGLAGPGGVSTLSLTTMGAAVGGPNVALAKLGTSPLGTLLPGLAPPVVTKPYPFPAATNPLIPPNNNATSRPGPWTTGNIVITNAAATPAETFTLSGKDSRTANGAGTIQFVSGALSSRAATGGNANRGWLRLVLTSPQPVPAMSPLGLAAMAGLLLLTAGYVMRRRLFA